MTPQKDISYNSQQLFKKKVTAEKISRLTILPLKTKGCINTNISVIISIALALCILHIFFNPMKELRKVFQLLPFEI